mmetsp:Transcript_5622/g.7975  ORF Transcript_5622/g.7975 Transcript_5622/m.7975 type:complete len:110 (-) Transcript_5622:1066-1395(-)
MSEIKISRISISSSSDDDGEKKTQNTSKCNNDDRDWFILFVPKARRLLIHGIQNDTFDFRVGINKYKIFTKEDANKVTVVHLCSSSLLGSDERGGRGGNIFISSSSSAG